jgi:hypothetical protein
MANKNTKLKVQDTQVVDETELFKRISSIIENRKLNAAVYANREVRRHFLPKLSTQGASMHPEIY